MAVPLAVLVGLKDPQALPLQVTVQFTPALAASLVTTAVRLAVAAVVRVVGAAGLKATEIGCTGAVMVMVAEAVAPEAVVAEIATEVAADGAV